MGEQNENNREQLLKGLLRDCASAITALLTSPDLNLDCLEQVTRDAIDVAREMLQEAATALEKETPSGTSATASLSEEATLQWFIIETERKTWTKYLVTAANVADAKERSDTGEYLGYRDGEDESCRVYGPFVHRDAALENNAGYVDGR